ncbi:GtrA family protein [Massilia sp. PWRC2]|uniref:GtrA family protein n=1 Tax=Massilia sp. PWRC2 TaxID=2804626 RepID=UPI003CF86F43
MPLRVELLRFVLAGVLGLAVDVGVLYGALALGLDWFSGRAISFICAVWTTWQFNRRYTFAPSKKLSVWQEWWRYLSAMLLGGAVNYVIYSVVVIALPDIPLLPFISVAAGSLSAMAVNFISAKYLVFRRSS